MGSEVVFNDSEVVFFSIEVTLEEGLLAERTLDVLVETTLDVRLGRANAAPESSWFVAVETRRVASEV